MARATEPLIGEATGSEHAEVYVGPRPFETGEKLFGRDREAADLLNLLIAERIVLLHSPSGAGKTSLVQAELLPRMIKKGFLVPRMLDEQGREKPVVIRVNALTDVPTSRMNRYILSMLTSLEQHRPLGDRRSPDQLAAYSDGILQNLLAREQELPEPDRRPAGVLATFLLDAYLTEEFPTAKSEADGRRGRPLLLIFDQFEEVLTVDRTDQPQKEAFFAALGVALRDRSRWALIAARDDHVAALDPLRGLLPTSLEAAYRLDFLGVEPAKMAIRGPAERFNVRFAPGLVEDLVKDLCTVRVPGANGALESKEGPFVEPVHLQVVCRRLWKERGEETEITRDHLENVKGAQGQGVDGVLAEYYAERVAAAAAEGGSNERLIRDWFGNQLIVAGIRRPVLRGEEAAFGVTPESLRVLDRAFLIRAEDRGNGVWYELAHDRLIGPVLRSNEAYRQRHLNRFQLQAELWARGNHSDDLLVRGELLAEGERWDNATPEADKTPVEKDFLKRCREVVGREIDERKRELRNVGIRMGLVSLVILSILLAIVLSLGYRARVRAKAIADQNASDQAQREQKRLRDQAEIRELVLTTQARAQTDARSAVRDALAVIAEANARKVDPTDAEGLLRTAMADEGWESLPMPLPLQDGRPVRPEEDPVTAAAFSPLGRSLAVGRRRGSMQVWTLDADGQLTASKVRPGEGVEISALAFTPDDGQLAIGYGDGRLVVVDTSNPEAKMARFDSRDRQGTTATRHRSAIREIIFSSDTKWFITVGLDGTNLLWSWKGFQQIEDLSRVGGAVVTTLAFTPYPRRMYFGGTDGQIHAMNLEADPPRTDRHRDLGENRPVAALAIHPSARMMVVAMSGGSSGFQKIAMDPRSKEALAEHEVVGAKSWLVQVEKSMEVGSVASLTFDDRGQWLVSRTLDRRMQLWKVGRDMVLQRQPIFPGRDTPLQSLRFEPVKRTGGEARWLVGDSGDGTILLWDLTAPGDTPLTLRGHRGPLTVFAMSPGGKRLLTACFDGTTRLWDMERLVRSRTTAEPRIFSHDAPVLAGSFSSRGDRFATFTERGGLQFVDLASSDRHPMARETNPNSLEYLRAQLGFEDETIAVVAGSHMEGPFLSRRWTIGRNESEDLKKPLFEAFFPNSMLIEEQFGNSGFTISADGRRLAALGNSGRRSLGWIDLNALTTAALVPLPDKSANSALNLLAMDRDGSHVIVIDPEQGIQVWEVRPGPGQASLVKIDERPWQSSGARNTPSPAGARITSIACGEDARQVAIGDEAGRVRLWDRSSPSPTGEPAVMVGSGEAVTALAIIPEANGRVRVVSGDGNGSVRVWSVSAGRPAGGVSASVLPDSIILLRGHQGPITSASVSPDGKLLLTTSRDGTARVWTIDRTALIERAERGSGGSLVEPLRAEPPL